MKFAITVFKMTIWRIRQTTVTSLFLIFGLTLSMLMISIGISFSYEHIYAGNNKKNNMPPNGEMYIVSSESEKHLNSNDIEKLFDGLRKGTGVIFSGLMAHPDRAKINSYYPVSAEWFTNDNEWHYPLASGRYYTADEIKNKEKVVLVGSTLKECIRKQDKKQYIDIQGEAYEVLGIIGVENQRTLWDNRIVMPCTVLPESIARDLTFSFINFILYNELGNLKVDQNIIMKNGVKIVSDFKIMNQGKLQIENMVEELLQSQDSIYYLAVLSYLVTIIYAVNIVVLWLEKRRYEIGLRKAFGYTDKEVAKLIFGEMFGIALLSSIIVLVIQAVMGEVVGRISKYTLTLSLPNILIALGFVLLTALLTSIWPVIRALKIPPADILKDGEIT